MFNGQSFITLKFPSLLKTIIFIPRLKNMKSATTILDKVFGEDVVLANKKALSSLEYYKKAGSIIERTNIALGKKKVYQNTSHSTLNSQLDIHAIRSTQKI